MLFVTLKGNWISFKSGLLLIHLENLSFELFLVFIHCIYIFKFYVSHNFPLRILKKEKKK